MRAPSILQAIIFATSQGKNDECDVEPRVKIASSGNAVYMIDKRQRAVQFDAECFQCTGYCNTASGYTHCRLEVHMLKFFIHPKECNLQLACI